LYNLGINVAFTSKYEAPTIKTRKQKPKEGNTEPRLERFN